MNFDYPLGATPLDPDEIEGLKPKHITTRSELDRWEQENINKALIWLDRRKRKSVLTEDFLRVLHNKMLGDVWTWVGSFRKRQKSIGVNWIQIPIELHQLLEDVKYWIDHETYDSDEIAARFHHRLVYIHLFPNGNGRHARLAADILLTDVLDRDAFTWGANNLNHVNATRDQYIMALRKADNSDYSKLLEFVRG